MKILVSSMTFLPDHSGISLYATDFAKYAEESGHKITVVTGFSYYPKWQKRPEDKGKLFRTDFWGSIKILRGYLYVPKKVTTLTRVLQEITFVLFALINFIRAGKQDVIVIFTTPINLGVLGVLFQKLWKSKLIINVQDLQLDAAASLGMVGNSPIIAIMKTLENFSYQQADIVSSISNGMLQLIEKKGVIPQKIMFWPNWINVQEARRHGVKGNFRNNFPEFKHKTLIGYAGNVGVKQGLSTLIDVAGQFTKEADLVFLIIGEGGDLPFLKSYAASKNVTNVKFLPFLSQTEYFDFLEDVDVVFLSQKKDSGDVYFPSKLLGIMAKSKLTLIHADPDSELYNFVKKNQVGIVTAFGDLPELTQRLDYYLQHREEFQSIEDNAYQTVLTFDRQPVLQAVIQSL